MNQDSLTSSVLQDLSEEYEIIGELGRGGTSIVYHARERELGRDVAIKLVAANQLDDREAVARLEREAKVVALLSHPNIVPLLSVRHLTSGLALIMQHVPGRTLKKTIREDGPLPIGAVEHILRDVASALDYAHRRHIVHRDLKPENIYLDVECGRALLSDFGIARSTESESSLTLTGTALGTPAYMSPEQIDGITIDGRSDLYSLGLVAWEMLTGQQPWAGCNLYTIIYKQKHDELPALANYRTDVPEYLQRSVEALLRKDREQRCSDAGHFLTMLPSTPTRVYTPPAVHSAVEQAPVAEDTPTLRYKRDDVVEEIAPIVVAAAAAAVVEPAIAPEPAIVHQPEAVREPEPEVVSAQVPEPEPVREPEPEPEPVREVEPEPEPVRAYEPQPEPEVVAPFVEFVEEEPEPTPVMAALTIPDLTPRDLVLEQTAVAVAPVTEYDLEPLAQVAMATRPRRRYLAAAVILFVVVGATAVAAVMRDNNPKPSGNWERISNTGAAAAGTQLTNELAAAPSHNVASKATDTTQKPTTDSTRAAAPEKPIQLPAAAPAEPNIALPDVGASLKTNDFSTPNVVPTTTAMKSSGDTPLASAVVAPDLQNRPAVQRALNDYYPPMLRERGVSGTVMLSVLVNANGKVLRARVDESSGVAPLDEAALKIAKVMRFSAPKDSVWVQIPVKFSGQ